MNTLPEQRTNTTPAPRLAPPNELYLNAIGRYWDRIFYDVGSLTLAEQNSLLQGGIWSPYAYREGEVIVVPPKTARRKIHHYKDTGRFLDEKSQDICAIVVAGVGSSVYGTAALARNVADTYNFDVAGIVTGYGFWNWIIEALDGWFVLGQSERENLPSSDFIARSPDIKTLIEIILTIPPDLKYLVGHSKGSL